MRISSGFFICRSCNYSVCGSPSVICHFPSAIQSVLSAREGKATSLGHLPSGLVAKATYLVRRGGLRYQLIAKATYLRLRLRFILRSSGKRINAARLLEIGGPAKRLAQFFLV